LRLANDTIIFDDVDLSSNWTSEALWLGTVQNFSVQLFFTGTPTGVFRLQVSNDRGKSPDSSEGVDNWSLYSGSSQVITEAGDHTWSVMGSSSRWVRVQWLSGSTPGSLTSAIFNSKGL